VNVSIKVYLHDFQEIVVPLYKNTYPVCDLTLRRYDK
jgi:hypothetical protein